MQWKQPPKVTWHSCAEADLVPGRAQTEGKGKQAVGKHSWQWLNASGGCLPAVVAGTAGVQLAENCKCALLIAQGSSFKRVNYNWDGLKLELIVLMVITYGGAGELNVLY